MVDAGSHMACPQQLYYLLSWSYKHNSLTMTAPIPPRDDWSFQFKANRDWKQRVCCHLVVS